MSIVVKPYTFSAGAVIIAAQHNSNFDTIYSDYNGNVDNNNIAASAGIVYSKLSLTNGIVNADINSAAAIAGSKLNLVSPGAIGTTTPAAGKFTTLEATTTLKLGTTNQGDILYDNGTSLVRLPPGTSGQALITAGAGANPAWGTGGALTLVSVTSFTSASTSGNITITNTDNYLVIVVAKNADVGTNLMGMRFNGDTGSNYIQGASSTTYMPAGTLVPGTGDQSAGYIMHFYINSDPFNSSSHYVDGTCIAHFVVGGYVAKSMSGFWSNNTVTSFSIVNIGGGTGSGNSTGTVYLYKYALS